uniref:C2H2-type domain-containing protein n=1 Tax=viral metagenome TaxID=1070528 RepID=A0A6C0JI74_9ZZZZ
MTDAVLPSITPKFLCNTCNFTCSKQSDWSRHVSTRKHKQKVEYLQKEPGLGNVHKCLCGKTYKHRQSLFTHKQSCEKQFENMATNIDTSQIVKNVTEISSGPTITNEMIINLLEQNKELQKQLVELSKQTTVINNNNTTTTNNTMNNQFNLNVFLNEECKDALNIADFVESLKLTVSDLEQTGRLGFTQGITRIFVQALKQLDVNMRPLHCTDIKRETVYIKDQDNWEKEDAEKTRLRNVLKRIARKNLKMLPEWQEKNPEFRYLDTRENNEFIQISLSSLGPESKEEQEKQEDKIIRNVLKEVALEKNKKIGL